MAVKRSFMMLLLSDLHSAGWKILGGAPVGLYKTRWPLPNFGRGFGCVAAVGRHGGMARTKKAWLRGCDPLAGQNDPDGLVTSPGVAPR